MGRRSANEARRDWAFPENEIPDGVGRRRKKKRRVYRGGVEVDPPSADEIRSSLVVCLSPECRERITPPRIFCPAHWGRLPWTAQERIVLAWTPGQADNPALRTASWTNAIRLATGYLRAVVAAERRLEEARGRTQG